MTGSEKKIISRPSCDYIDDVGFIEAKVLSSGQCFTKTHNNKVKNILQYGLKFSPHRTNTMVNLTIVKGWNKMFRSTAFSRNVNCTEIMPLPPGGGG